MKAHTLARRQHLKTQSKIVLVVADGLGGLPMNDGDFGRKVAELEKLDQQIAAIRQLAPDVLIVTGDHSTPA